MKAGKILIVDDTKHILTLLCDLLDEEGYKTIAVENGEIALEFLENNTPDLILLDIRMPVMSGFEVCKRIKQNKILAKIPIIFLTAAIELNDKLEGFRLGAVDYITKPFHEKELLVRVKTHIRLRQNEIKLKKINKELIKVNEYKNNFLTFVNNIHGVGFIKDINLRYTFINKKFEKVFNVKLSDWKGKSNREINFFPIEIIDVLERYDRKIINNKLPTEFIENVPVNGKMHNWLTIKFPLYDNENNIKSVAGMAIDITDRIENEKIIFNAIVKAEEKERTHFAAELHDGLGPLISTLKIFMQAIDKVEDTNKIKEFAKKSQEVFDEILQTITEVSNNLSPHILHKFGLYIGIKTFIERNAKHTGINFILDYKHKQIETAICRKTNKLNELHEITIYRIVTELINNSIKHSKANEIRIKFYIYKHSLHIDYSDNGIGFDIKTVYRNSTGLGMQNIKNRLKNINGNVKFISFVNKGFLANIVIHCSV